MSTGHAFRPICFLSHYHIKIQHVLFGRLLASLSREKKKENALVPAICTREGRLLRKENLFSSICRGVAILHIQ